MPLPLGVMFVNSVSFSYDAYTSVPSLIRLDVQTFLSLNVERSKSNPKPYFL
jgi:hypothetical protein